MTQTNRILVAGLGKSGTTALYFKIKSSMPGDVHGYFEPRQLSAFDHVAGTLCPFVAKVLTPLPEEFMPRLRDFFSHRVLIVRDPRDVLISSLLYNTAYTYLWRYQDREIRTAIDLLKRKEEDGASLPVLELFSRLRDDFDAMTFTAFCRRMLGAVMELANPEFEFFVMTYEAMIDQQWGRLEDYLGFPLTGSSQVADELRRVERSKGSGEWRNWFRPDDVDFFRPLLEPFLHHFGYHADDWALNPQPTISSRHCSEYACKVLNERRGSENLSLIADLAP